MLGFSQPEMLRWWAFANDTDTHTLDSSCVISGGSERARGGLKNMNVLISSGGRRVGLAKCFRESLTELGIGGRLIGIDATPYSSIAHFTDAFYTVPPCTHETFIPVLKQICEREQVDVIVPCIDTELPVYAAVKDEFHALGTTIAVSAPATVAISRNKQVTHAWLSERGFSVPRQSTPANVLAHGSEWPLPLLIKPSEGSASIGVQILHSFEGLASAAQGRDGLIVQELIAGREHTVNVFVNGRGQCICAVPHLRIEVRAGEVSKAMTVKHPRLIEMVRKVVEALPGAYGALNVQCFLTPADEIRIIEINARFGGGYPLAHAAGAKMTQWLLEDILGSGPEAFCDTWEDGLLMLRYDDAIFSSKANSAKPEMSSEVPCAT